MKELKQDLRPLGKDDKNEAGAERRSETVQCVHMCVCFSPHRVLAIITLTSWKNL